MRLKTHIGPKRIFISHHFKDLPAVSLTKSSLYFSHTADFRERRRQKAREKAMKPASKQDRPKRERDPNRVPNQQQQQQQMYPPPQLAGGVPPPGFPPMPPHFNPAQWGGQMPPPPPGFQGMPGMPPPPFPGAPGFPPQQSQPQQPQGPQGPISVVPSASTEEPKGPPTFVVFDDPQYSMEERRAQLDRYNISSERMSQQFQRVGQSIDSRLNALGVGVFGGHHGGGR